MWIAALVGAMSIWDTNGRTDIQATTTLRIIAGLIPTTFLPTDTIIGLLVSQTITTMVKIVQGFSTKGEIGMMMTAPIAGNIYVPFDKLLMKKD